MKTIFLSLLSGGLLLISLSCNHVPDEEQSGFVEKNAAFAAQQYTLQTQRIEESEEILNPRTFIDGEIRYVRPQSWTSGFFPGSMWYLYELTGEEKWKNFGQKYTEALDTVKYLTNHHDVGFMIGCSYGNGLRLTGNEAYEEVIVQAAKSLSTRFRSVVGVIQSWNVTGRYEGKHRGCTKGGALMTNYELGSVRFFATNDREKLTFVIGNEARNFLQFSRTPMIKYRKDSETNKNKKMRLQYHNFTIYQFHHLTISTP